MVADDSMTRFAGRPVLCVPGSRSALRRTIAHTIPGHETIRLPDLPSALSQRRRIPATGANRVRHLQDGVTFFACVGTSPVVLSKSMRANVNVLIASLDTVEAWALTDPPTRRRAVRAIQSTRSDWQPQPFVIAARPRR